MEPVAAVDQQSERRRVRDTAVIIEEPVVIGLRVVRRKGEDAGCAGAPAACRASSPPSAASKPTPAITGPGLRLCDVGARPARCSSAVSANTAHRSRLPQRSRRSGVPGDRSHVAPHPAMSSVRSSRTASPETRSTPSAASPASPSRHHPSPIRIHVLSHLLLIIPLSERDSLISFPAARERIVSPASLRGQASRECAPIRLRWALCRRRRLHRAADCQG